ncbi:glycoside hydrolase family 99-like domain-containing protein [Paludisphaera mucosa]|uniref:Glycoside hydrolase family 99-like domain-containing protein n=1 Tax=Paludisphaera mucosa TaxID=3030827 RepID=A0ABT6FF43_9BACT|nr:glycoside hydrolase family 99-like domain-containing protein [Paludisphaera mucosa]MDG3006152.1 glycoside hydrolase family 99-like domain-containing protein [Paludisphaera mucosa]
MRSLAKLMFIALLAQASWQASAAPPAEARAKVGAYYFDGWTGKTFHITERLTTEFADREPIWGWRDDSVAVMEEQIGYAADAGVAFFSFCWYWPEGPDKACPMNQALDFYHQAKNRERLEFCLLVANHGGYRIGPKAWDEVSAVWVGEFQKPGHLKLGGEPLLIFFSPRELIQEFGSPEAVASAFEKLRARARAAGLSGVKIAGCATPGPEYGWDDLEKLAACGFDLFTGYNYPGAGRKGPELERPFAELTEGSEGVWDGFARKSPRPYVPVVTAGWDMRPWEKPGDAKPPSLYYVDRTPAAVADAVDRGIRWLDRHPDRTLPERLLLVYAWNENGEGGYLTPTKSGGTAFLDAFRKVVARPRP